MRTTALLTSLGAIGCGLLSLTSSSPPAIAVADAVPERGAPRIVEPLLGDLRQPLPQPRRLAPVAVTPADVQADRIESATDIYQPSTLAPLPRPTNLTREDEAKINDCLDDLREGGGLQYIRAPRKLAAMGTKMLPIAVMRMMRLDYSKPKNNQHAYSISEAIKRLTEFELAFDPVRIVEEFELIQGHANALKVKNLHHLVQVRWFDDVALAIDKARRNDAGR